VLFCKRIEISERLVAGKRHFFDKLRCPLRNRRGHLNINL
jgi:hypothetical protein